MRTLLIAAAVTALLALPACNQIMNSHRASRSIDQSVEHIATSSLIVDTVNGSVEVDVSPRHDEVIVHARLTCGGQTGAEAEQRVAEATVEIKRDTSRTLTIKPIFPGGTSKGDGASFVVMLPAADGVSIDASNGSVGVTGTTGELVVDTSNGPVTVRGHDGTVRVDTSNGPVMIADATGPVTVDTSNGAIDVSLTPGNAGPLRADTSNGSIRATVGHAFTGRMTLDTSNAHVTIRDDAKRIVERTGDRDHSEIVVGEQGPPSRLDTSNGGITLVVEG
ncbi:MAG: DUF4097 domain-containing protein [Planctomycetes bacterium]|nr:DUF4097 domain-containing protein [Planctomycetota bacterium]